MRAPRPGLPRSRPAGLLILALLLIGIVYGLFLAAAFRTPADAGLVRIAVLGPLTGPGAGYGLSQKMGVELAAKEIEESQDLKGRRLQLLFEDDEGKQEKVADLAVRLICRDGVTAFIGCIDSACTHVLQMITVKMHVPMITTTSTDPSINQAGSPWTFRCLANDVLQAKALADHLFTRRGFRRVAVLRQDNRYGKMGAREIARVARERGRPVVLLEAYKPDQADLGALVEKVKDARADALVLWGLYAGAARITRQARANLGELPVFGSDGLAHPKFFELAGSAAEGVVLTCPFDAERDDPGTRRFVRSFRAAYGKDPDSFAAHSYDALKILAAAIGRGGTDRDRLKEETARTRGFPGVTGPVTFDAKGDDTRAVILARVVEGRLRTLDGTR